MGFLRFFYDTRAGRFFLRPVISRPVSAAAGVLLDTRISKWLIPLFIRRYHIRTEDYVPASGIPGDDYKSFNDFFCRRIKSGLRPVCSDRNRLIAPCDGLLSAVKIASGTVVKAKQSRFTIPALLKDEKLARRYDGGYCLIFRLCVDHYHRYNYFDSGYKYKDRKIRGVFHTVRPEALGRYPVFVQNSREYSVIDTEHFGRCVQMEIGALLVGRIVNNEPQAARVRRGEEKGRFEYGGSTVIILVPAGRIRLSDEVLNCAEKGLEMPVKMGEPVADKI